MNPKTFKASAARHVGVIMDGNGRFAAARSMPRSYGHAQGVRAAARIIECAVKESLECLSLFVFSTENWRRPQTEVNFLMQLILTELSQSMDKLQEQNVRVSILGDTSTLPPKVQEVLVKTQHATRNCHGMRLVLAINYGGRQEILRAAVRAAQHAQQQGWSAQDLPCFIDEALLGGFMDSAPLPVPELIIRTGGGARLSNFYLWSAAYSELYISPKMWPEFSKEDFIKALQHYKNSSLKSHWGGLSADKEPGQPGQEARSVSTC